MSRPQWAVLLLVALLSILQMLPHAGDQFWVSRREDTPNPPYSEDELLVRRAATRNLVAMVRNPWVIRRYWRPATQAWAWLTYRVGQLNPLPYRLQMAFLHALAVVLVGMLAVRLGGAGWAGPLAGAAFAFAWWGFWTRQWIACAGDLLASPLLAGAAMCSQRGRWGWLAALSRRAPAGRASA